MNKNLFKIALVLTTSLLLVAVAFLILSGTFSDALDNTTKMTMCIVYNFCAVFILAYGLFSNNE